MAGKFHAEFTAYSNRWRVNLDDKIEFEVEFMNIVGHNTEKRLAATVREVEGINVIGEFGKNRVIVKQIEQIKIETIPELWDPDRPRNLAKSVTVR